MLMRYPTEEDLRMSLPQTPPAYMALMPSFPSFILHFPFSLSFSLSVLLPFKSYHRFAEDSHFSCIPPCSLLPISFSLSLSACLFSCPSPFSFIYVSAPPFSPSLSLYLLIFLVSQPLPPTRHLSQQSMPFHSGEGTNGIPAESVAAGGEQRLFCDADSPCLPLTLQQRPQVPIPSSHTHIHRPLVHGGTP